jgi:hypothetical protein
MLPNTIRFVEAFKDRTDKVHLQTGLENDSVRSCWVTFNVRELTKCFDVSNNILSEPPIIDLMTIFDHVGEVSSLLKKQKIETNFPRLEERLLAAFKAMKTARVDVDSFPLDMYIPFINEFLKEKVRAARLLFEKITPEMYDQYVNKTWPLMISLMEIERNRIKIDRSFVEQALKRKDLATHERKMLQGTLDTLSSDSYVRQRINPNGTRTHRLGNLKGFQAMAIPHGVCRESVVSRFEGGQIVSIDFNAIDYRSIIRAVDDPGLTKMYGDADDFHRVTAEYLDPENAATFRDGVKKLTYVLIYGGSQETMRAIELPKDRIDGFRDSLEELFKPITKFRKQLSDDARRDGYVVTPAGLKVAVAKDDHDGKIVGLFAQTFSSSVFNSVLDPILSMTREKQSRLIFTVHDEFNIDVHPEELQIIEELVVMIEQKTGFKVSVTMGDNYAQATD